MSDTPVISKSHQRRGRIDGSSVAPREGDASPRRQGRSPREGGALPRRRGRIDNSIDAPREGDALPRRRGAPIGNTNALRHGWYAKNLGGISPRQLDEAEMRNLLGEAAMLKDFMFRLYKDNIDSTDSEVIASTLRILSLAGIALSRVLQTHQAIRIYSGQVDSPLNNILAALDEETHRVENSDI